MNKKLINEDIKNMKYLLGYKPGRVISEQDIDYTTDDYLDMTEMGEEETTESILEKHNLLDEAHLVKSNAVMFRNKSSEVIQSFLHILPLLTDLQLFTIENCESADFSDVDICGLSNLTFINLTGTENNFEEQGYECSDKQAEDFYFIIE